MKFPVLLGLFIVKSLPSFAIICPDGFTNNGADCYGPLDTIYSIDADGSRSWCKDFYNGVPYVIDNAFQNSDIQSSYAEWGRIWLGLRCFDVNSTSCTWDNGKQIRNVDYSNFAPGQPDPYVGVCVFMDAKSGKWFSSDCHTFGRYGCSFFPGLTVPFGTCWDAYQEYLNGNCYYVMAFPTAEQTFTGCQQHNPNAFPGNATSIHSPGENSFIRDYSMMMYNYSDQKNRTQDAYVFIGLEKTATRSYVWSDGTPTDYLNFGTPHNTKDCALMQFGDNGLAKRGEWIPIGCDERPDPTIYANVWSICAYPYVEDPLPPIDCSSPIYLNTTLKTMYPDGAIYSPGFPLMTTSAIVCTYIVTGPDENKLSLSFNRILVDNQSSIKVYDGLPEDGRLMASISNVKQYRPELMAHGNVISLVYTTTGEYTNRFKAYGHIL